MRKLLGYDPLTQLETWHDYDSETDTTIIQTVGDAEPVLEYNKALAKDTDVTKLGIKRGFWLYAKIPPSVQAKWMIEEGIDIYNKHHGDRISKKLEDPQWRHLKTTAKHHKFK